MTTYRFEIDVVLALALALCPLGQRLEAQEQPSKGLAFQSANALYSDCVAEGSEPEALVDLLACQKYIEGAVDGHEAMAAMGLPNRAFCLRARLTRQQVRDVVVEWIRENPAKRDLPGAGAVIIAEHEAFPCPSAATK